MDHIGPFVGLVSKVRHDGMSKDTAVRIFSRLKEGYPNHAEILLNDLFTAAIAAGNLPLAKWCYGSGKADIFIQGKRFNDFAENRHFENRPTEQNKPTLDWLWEELTQLDSMAHREYARYEHRFCRKQVGCNCRVCTATEPADLLPHDEPPVALPFLGPPRRYELERVKVWLETLQRNGLVHKNHRQDHAEYLAAVNKHIKYLNRRYN